MTPASKGIAAIIAACGIWGVAPVWYRVLHDQTGIAALDVLAHRGLWTLLGFGAVLAGQGRLPAVLALLRGPDRWRVAIASAWVAVNWGLFIWAIQGGHGVEAGLGYYIFPLVSVAMGVVFLGERLHPLQWAGVVLALSAVVVLAYGLGVAPWIALSLALTFAPYMLIKKRLKADAAVSVMAEVVLMAGPSVLWLAVAGGGEFGRDMTATLMLPVTGALTGLPLMLFSWGAQRVRLATVGLVQYLNPSLQVGLAVLAFHEAFTRWHMIALALIWAGVAIYSGVALRQDRAARSLASSVSTSGTGMK